MFPIIPANSATASFPGNDEGIFGYGYHTPNPLSMTNIVSNAGVVATDVAGVGGSNYGKAACEFGGDQGIFGYGPAHLWWGTNLVSNTGVVATDVTLVGTANSQRNACEYGQDKGIMGFGQISGPAATAITNLVSNTGVVSTDVTGVGTTRKYLAGCSFN